MTQQPNMQQSSSQKAAQPTTFLARALLTSFAENLKGTIVDRMVEADAYPIAAALDKRRTASLLQKDLEIAEALIPLLPEDLVFDKKQYHEFCQAIYALSDLALDGKNSDLSLLRMSFGPRADESSAVENSES